MRLSKPFLKLPIRFDSEALAAEVRALPATAWTPHPTGYIGNEAVRLITPNGEASDDIRGAMAPTPNLQHCEYIREVMAEIGGVWGRSRLMGLAPGSEVPSHVDINYYWRTHLRIHIPVITNPGVLFTCGDETVHMAAGECWVFDSFRWHDVQNKGDAQRIHLVLDTVGGGILPELLKAAEKGTETPRFLSPGERSGEGLAFEMVNAPQVMSPWEMRCHHAFVAEQAGSDPRVLAVLDRVEAFILAWVAAWAQFGESERGRPSYSRLLASLRADLIRLDIQNLLTPNGLRLQNILEELIFAVALAPAAAASAAAPVADQGSGTEARKLIDRPIFIVSTPRSGSTLLYETLEQAPGLYSTGDESHWLIEGVAGLSPAERGWTSNRLTAADASGERAEQLSSAFYAELRDRDQRPPRGAVRMLEKTPKNALRVPFFDAVWPDSRFVYLYRDVRETLYSMMEAWHSGGFRTYPDLPGWRGPDWSLLLVPGWQRLNGMQLPQIVANQWAITTEFLLSDLEQLGEARVCAIDHADIIAAPQDSMQRLTRAIGLDWDRDLSATLPLSKNTLSQPQREKWRRIQTTIEAVWPIVENTDRRARAFLDRHRV